MKLIKGRFYHVGEKVMEYIGNTHADSYLFQGASDIATEISTRWVYNRARLEVIAENPASVSLAFEVKDRRAEYMNHKGRDMAQFGTH